MNETEKFQQEKLENIARLGEAANLKAVSNAWIGEAAQYKYTYHFSWMGRPIIQLPQDMISMQEIIWAVKPQLIIETGIAHGGSLIFYASMMELLGGDGRVIGIDIEIFPHNRAEIEKHPMAKRITMLEGSSVDEKIVNRVRQLAQGKSPIMVLFDSNHTHDHVAKELECYASLVTKGSYLVVFDTVIEDYPAEMFQDRPWGPGNNPKTAVHEFLKTTDRFVIDEQIQNKLLITVAPDGYLKCVKD